MPIFGIAVLAGLAFTWWQHKKAVKETIDPPPKPASPPLTGGTKLPTVVPPGSPVAGLPMTIYHAPIIPPTVPFNPGIKGQGMIVDKAGINHTNTHAMTVARVTLHPGDKGPAVIQWQTAIGEATTGIMDPNTVFMTKEFQKSHGLVVDGIVGLKTWAKVPK